MLSSLHKRSLSTQKRNPFAQTAKQSPPTFSHNHIHAIPNPFALSSSHNVKEKSTLRASRSLATNGEVNPAVIAAPLMAFGQFTNKEGNRICLKS